MGVYNLDKIFKPDSIAVIGASQKEGSIGNALMHSLIDGGFQGRLYPVNPRHSTIHGLRAHRSILDVNSRTDLAIVATPIPTVPVVINQCVRAGVGGAIIVSAGGRETGQEGHAIEGMVEREAQTGGLRIIGPNCLGVICPRRRLNASFAAHMPPPGRLAFVSQSGAICTAILDIAPKEAIGFSYFVSIGSMLDVDFGDMIDYLGADHEVSSILLYMESLSSFRKFMSAARAVSRLKPIVVLKSGRSPAGMRAAASHTGAMAGEDEVYDAAFKRAGIVRVDTIGELFDCAELLAKQPRLGGARLGVITNAGGPGVMAADALALYGTEPAELELQTIEQLDRILPPLWSKGNPIDILGDASPERYAMAMEVCLEAKELDGVLAILTPQAMTDPTGVAEAVAQAFRRRRRALLASWMGGVDVARGREILNQAGIPTYDVPEHGIRAVMHMYEFSRNLEMLQEIPAKVSRRLRFDRESAGALIEKALQRERAILTEVEAKRLLAAYGICVNRTELATCREEAAQLAEAVGYPVVMKIVSPDILHKTEAEGVQLDLRSENEVSEAYRRIMEGAERLNPEAKILGVSVQAMVGKVDYEILLGARRDENFGPVIVFGMGGVFAEVLKDWAIGLPPLNVLLARRLMEETRVYSLLRGYRNRPAADLERLEATILRLSQLVVDFPEIAELDMNPVVVSEGIPHAVDARVILEPSKAPSPRHLVISPYPEEYEYREVTTGGVAARIRPIRPEDAPLLEDLFDTLSPTSIYFRFFTPLKALPHWMLARFTQVDYDREIVLVALREGGEGDERMLGVARVVSDPDGKRAEFAVVVGDPWHGKGVGARLLERCLGIARERGIETVWGTVLRQNTQMLALGRKLGFRVSGTSEPGELELTADLTRVKF